MRHLSLLAVVFALFVMPAFGQEWRVELRSGASAPWAAVGVYPTAEAAKEAFVALPLGGSIEGRIVTTGTLVSAPAIVEEPAVLVEESEPTLHPTWYRFGYRRSPLGFRYLKHHKHHKHHNKKHYRPSRHTGTKGLKHRRPATKRPQQQQQRRGNEQRRRGNEQRRGNERRSNRSSHRNARSNRSHRGGKSGK